MKITAETRLYKGTGASRRLRKTGVIPGIIYGSKKEATMIHVDHTTLFRALQNEAFHSSILDLELDGKKEKVLLRDFQMHAFRREVLHVDFQRVASDQKIHVKVPLHFINAENSQAVKVNKCLIGHVANEIEISCLPKDLPEHITVDLMDIKVDGAIHLNDITLPPGVSAVSHTNPTLATANLPSVKEDAADPAPAAPVAEAGADKAKK